MSEEKETRRKSGKRKLDAFRESTLTTDDVDHTVELADTSYDVEGEATNVSKFVCPIDKDGVSIFEGLPPICHCIACFVYLGEQNPRQLCEKTTCPYEYFEPMELVQIRISNMRDSPYKNHPEYSDKFKKAFRYQDMVCKNFR